MFSTKTPYHVLLIIALWASIPSYCASFSRPLITTITTARRSCGSSSRSQEQLTTILHSAAASSSGGRRSSSNNKNKERSKRQERVSQLVRTELAHILHTGNIKGSFDVLDDELRQRISVVNTDVSPDMRQARVSVSIRRRVTAPLTDTATTSGLDDTVMDQRRAYSWLVSNTKALRHSLAQRMSHMKNCPDLTFVQVNVGAAVDVMYLIDKVSKGYKREIIEDDALLEDDDDKDSDWLGNDLF